MSKMIKVSDVTAHRLEDLARETKKSKQKLVDEAMKFLTEKVKPSSMSKHQSVSGNHTSSNHSSLHSASPTHRSKHKKPSKRELVNNTMLLDGLDED